MFILHFEVTLKVHLESPAQERHPVQNFDCTLYLLKTGDHLGRSLGDQVQKSDPPNPHHHTPTIHPGDGWHAGQWPPCHPYLPMLPGGKHVLHRWNVLCVVGPSCLITQTVSQPQCQGQAETSRRCKIRAVVPTQRISR